MGESETVAGDSTEVVGKRAMGHSVALEAWAFEFWGKRRLCPPMGTGRTMGESRPWQPELTLVLYIAPDTRLTDFKGRSTTVYAAVNRTVTWGSK